jgi:carboxypeptidase C (cathepsin A)
MNKMNYPQSVCNRFWSKVKIPKDKKSKNGLKNENIDWLSTLISDDSKKTCLIEDISNELMKISYINGNILNRGFSCGNINSVKEVVEKTYLNKYSKQVIKIDPEIIREEIILNTIEIDNLDELTKTVMSKFITNE